MCSWPDGHPKSWNRGPRPWQGVDRVLPRIVAGTGPFGVADASPSIERIADRFAKPVSSRVGVGSHEHQVNEVFDAGVLMMRVWARIGMEFLGDVLFD